MYTIPALEKINVPYIAVIEKQEYRHYAKVIDPKKLLVLPHQNEGLTVTRNWIWDYVQNELKTPYFWTMDDNIWRFFRLHKNIKYRCKSGTFLYIIEDFVERFTNLYVAGMHYDFFVPRKIKRPPLLANTRVYSNMLIKTDIPYRNVTFYNDDTDLCLRILKDGFCTVLFNAFCCKKIQTMTVKGGMTEYYKQTNKRLEFAKELQQAHPDVVKIVWKWNRWHHQVDYRPFKNNRLIYRDDYVPSGNKVNNYGMVLRNAQGAELQQGIG
jgi:hypothetical protein